ncbi:MAG: hypothetical protein HQK55_03885 [Deltaproteobacteria bacterium]|nr:hypothetical protein [Deltaproteobacteria bacterium]
MQSFPLHFPRALSVFSIENNLVIFHAHSLRYWALNSMARRIFEGLYRGDTVDIVAQDVASAFSFMPMDALHIVESTISSWHSSGLLLDGDTLEAQMLSNTTDTPGASIVRHADERTGTVDHLRPASDIPCYDYAIEEVSFRLILEDPLFARIHLPLFAQYRTGPVSDDALCLSLRREEAAYRLCRDGCVIEWTESYDIVSTKFIQTLVGHVCGLEAYAAVFHGAAVVVGEALYLFPGKTGSGKSTLAAALVCSGFTCINDDTLFARADDERFFSLPLSIKLRQPSWPLIAPIYPGIDRLPVTDLPQSAVKFFPAPRLPLQQLRSGFVLKGIFFPTVVPAADDTSNGDAEAACPRLSATESFVRLLEGATWIAPEPERMGRILALIERTPAFELRYTTLDQALIMIKDKLRP